LIVGHTQNCFLAGGLLPNGRADRNFLDFFHVVRWHVLVVASCRQNFWDFFSKQIPSLTAEASRVIMLLLLLVLLRLIILCLFTNKNYFGISYWW